MAEVNYVRGLAGVVADESRICTIDGVKGELYYYGYPIQVLAEKSSFMEISFLLLNGRLPSNRKELSGFESELASHREVPGFVESIIRAFPKEAHPMSSLQAIVATMGMQEPQSLSDSLEGNRQRSIRLTAMFPTLVAYIHRHRTGQEFIRPRQDLSHAANFLYMLNGQVPTAQLEKMFDVCLILHAEHTFNASTFAGRVIGSTLANLYASVSGAVGALFGPLHGGANEMALEMVKSIGSVEKADSWFAETVSKKRKIMGMGHRVYKTIDPRAKIIRKMLEELAQQKGETTGLKILDRLAELMRKKLEGTGKEIWPNVDFYSGSLYTLMGIDSINFTPIFAISRITGWSAHILELWSDNRLYRPKAQYVGEKDLPFLPIDAR